MGDIKMILDRKYIHSMQKRTLFPFKQHRGTYEADISHGYKPGRADWAVVRDETTDTGVVAVKIDEYFAAYDYKDFMKGNWFVLLSKKCIDTDQAYSKLMKFIGKMVKKDNNPRNRYLHKHLDHAYGYFEDVFTDDILEDIRNKITI